MSNTFIAYIKARLHDQNKNFLAAVVGPTGSGKSWAGLKLCEEVDPNFTIEQVVFSPKEFINLLRSGKLKRGSAVLFDESGVSANSRNYQTATNKALHYLNQTFRSQNFCVIYTLPDFGFMDIGIRKLCHALLQTQNIDYDAGVCWTRPLMIENNAQSGKIYMKYPRMRNKTNPRQTIAITALGIRKPSPALIDAYEQRKLEYNNTLQAGIQETLNRTEGNPRAQEHPVEDLQPIVDAINKNPGRYKTKRGALNFGALQKDYGVSETKLRRLRGLISLQGDDALLSKSEVEKNTIAKQMFKRTNEITRVEVDGEKKEV